MAKNKDYLQDGRNGLSWFSLVLFCISTFNADFSLYGLHDEPSLLVDSVYDTTHCKNSAITLFGMTPALDSAILDNTYCDSR